MANHARQQLRTALVTRVTGLTTTGPRVFASRMFPMAADSMPGLIVYTNDESSDDGSLGIPRLQHRTVSLSIEGYAKAANGLDDLLDQIAKEVETAISADPLLGGKARDCAIADTAFDLGAADQNIGVIRMRYVAKYNVKEGVVDALL